MEKKSYFFAETKEQLYKAIEILGLPCVIKPTVSSSGKGQSVIKNLSQVDAAWEYAQTGGRAASGKVIVEEWIDFDYEITLLTVRHSKGTSFCEPIGHLQIDGDYRESWQPHPMPAPVLKEAQHIAQSVTDRLGGIGIFGVELFIKGDEVYFSEVSPRPHDTGMVTLISQNLSEFALHARAVLGLPIPAIFCNGPSASCALLVNGHSSSICYSKLEDALMEPMTDLRLFGKPKVEGHRRMGVGLARGKDVDEARFKAKQIIDKVVVTLE